MKYPKLIRKQDCKTPITIKIFNEDLGEDGETIIYKEIKTFCNYQSSAKRKFTDDKKIIEISGVALFAEDIAPDLAEITSGEVIIFGEKRNILKGTKARNPDGSVNYIKLEII